MSTAQDVAANIRRMRGILQAVPGSSTQYAEMATGRDLAPPIDAEGQHAYLAIALEIMALCHAGADPVHDLDGLLAVSLVRAVLGQM